MSISLRDQSLTQYHRQEIPRKQNWHRINYLHHPQQTTLQPENSTNWHSENTNGRVNSPNTDRYNRLHETSDHFTHPRWRFPTTNHDHEHIRIPTIACFNWTVSASPTMKVNTAKSKQIQLRARSSFLTRDELDLTLIGSIMCTVIWDYYIRDGSHENPKRRK